MTRDYILAPSILAADFLHLEKSIQTAEEAGADWIHVDVMDGHFVPNISMGPLIVEAARRATKLPLDVHLMIETPERYLGAFAEAGADGLTVHVEAASHLHRTLSTIKELGLRPGVAVNPATPLETVTEVLDLAKLVLLMTVNPGFSGQSFIREVLGKVRQMAEWKEASRTKALIEVDGGIDAQTARLAVVAGAEVFVAGSAIFDYQDGIGAGIQSIRSSLELVNASTGHGSSSD